ncbi:MAG: fahA [Aeromicrobium sp.]|nr:fahA [Aeromicrobium sp.]
MTDFGRTTLPYCSFVRPGDDRPRVGIGVGTDVMDVTDRSELFAGGTLDRLLAAGPDGWHDVREAANRWVDEPGARAHVVPAADVELRLPFAVADYVDFYASEHHATNVGRILRPDGDALPASWKHLPIGYHGRSGTVVVSGTPVRRPHGQTRAADGTIGFGPTQRLDLEAEIGFVVGAPSCPGEPVPVGAFADHVFGICVVNDWSARDIQAWETVPLGPFLGKSFATSVSPWVVPLASLAGARVDPPERSVELLPYLRDEEPWGLDLELVVTLNGEQISRPPFAAMYWTGAQMLAHLTVNGASLRTGDLFASGTVSGPSPDEVGSLLERGAGFLADGDCITISASARLADGHRIALGEVDGRITT